MNDPERKKAIQIIKTASERVQKLNYRLKSHVHASKGGTSLLVRHDAVHGLTEITRTPKISDYRHGTGVKTWQFDGDENEIDDWGEVLTRIAQRVQSGYYDDADDAEVQP